MTPTPATSNTTPSAAPVPTPLPPIQQRPRPKLADPERFDGTDLTLFPQFLSQLKAKLLIDEASLGGELEQIWYGYSRLGGKAAARIHAWIAANESSPSFTLQGFYSQLESAFSDPTRQEKALVRLNTLRQGNRSVLELVAELNGLLLEAGGSGWEDRVKKGYLKSALNRTIENRLINIEEKETYDGFCQQVQEISHRLENFKRKEKGPWAPPYYKNSGEAVIPSSDTMDWEPAVKTASSRRAKWVTQEEINRRWSERLIPIVANITGAVLEDEDNLEDKDKAGKV
ncbi:hypothetical protein EYZ11_013168 [Aspergillus tanneri]|uniref:Uncharacterized protein n=1 Tax=Aspergillus tanneri TaxID=1220188 RepID=A0A4S3J0G5_9EURO|nr:hypothetical protein EYZ11_013168 [Aspergillus tanneri]